jgi:predicted DNA-binding protein
MPDKLKHTHVIIFRVSEEQWEKLKKRAKNLSSVAAYLRYIIDWHLSNDK